MYTTIRTVLLSISIALITASSTQSVTISSDYNLGRIVGPGPMSNNTQPTFDPFTVSDLFFTQGGIENKLDTKLWLFGGFIQMPEDYYYESSSAVFFSLPRFSLLGAPNSSHRLGFSTDPLNLLFGMSNGELFSGFEMPLYLLNTYSWDFLSNEATVKIDENEKDDVYYFGPLLNAFQFKSSISLTHQLKSIYISEDVFRISSLLALGLTDFLQIQTRLVINTYEQKGYGEEYVVPVLQSDSLFYSDEEFQFEATGRFANLTLTGKFSSFNYPQTYLTASYISESLIPHAEGNWDRYFDNHLAKNQFKSAFEFFSLPYEGISEIDSDGNVMTGGKNFFKLQCGYGLLENLTLGGRVHLDSKGYLAAFAQASLLNIKRRDYGPSEASSYEYCFGLKPRKGQYKAEVWYRFPIDEDPDDFFYRLSNFPLISNSPMYHVPELAYNDLKAKVSLGILDQLYIENDFAMYFAKGENSSAYTNSFSVAFIDHDRFSYSLGVTFGRANGNVYFERGTNNIPSGDFSISGTLQAVF